MNSLISTSDMYLLMLIPSKTCGNYFITYAFEVRHLNIDTLYKFISLSYINKAKQNYRQLYCNNGLLDETIP